MRALSIAATGMLAQQTNVEVIANNLANMNTTGLQAAARRVPGSALSERRAARRAVLGFRHRAAERHPDRRRRAHRRGLSHHQPGRRSTNTSQPLRPRDQRHGLFPHHHAGRHRRLYARRQFRALAGRPDRHRQGLRRGARASPCPPTRLAITINAQGQVQATVPGQTAPQTRRPARADALPQRRRPRRRSATICFTETPSSGSPQSGVPGSPGYGTIQQGFLETSNVNAVEEITSLITAQRAYEMNSKVITAADQMLQETSRWEDVKP